MEPGCARGRRSAWRSTPTAQEMVRKTAGIIQGTLVAALPAIACSETNVVRPQDKPKDTSTWKWAHPFPQGHGLRDVWGSSATDVFMVGEKGVIVHFDGAMWTVMDSGTREDLHAVWGLSATDVYAVGDNGTIVHYDGTGWALSVGPTSVVLHAIWGSSANKVFAVGNAGTILEYGP